MTSLYSKCNNLSPDFFPELLLSSRSNSQGIGEDSDLKNTPIHGLQCYNCWLEKIALLGKTTMVTLQAMYGSGGFVLFVLYLSIPKPDLTS